MSAERLPPPKSLLDWLTHEHLRCVSDCQGVSIVRDRLRRTVACARCISGRRELPNIQVRDTIDRLIQLEYQVWLDERQKYPVVPRTGY